MRKICEIENCGKYVHGRGYCGTHYDRWLKHGDANYDPRANCAWPSCTIPVNQNKGTLCAKHSAAKENKKYKETHRVNTFRTIIKTKARKIGLDPDEVLAYWETHNGLCDVCGNPPEKLRKSGVTESLHIEHNHITGKFRGLVCHKCNLGMGLLNDSADLLRKAADFLDRDGIG
jgi:hypothetical protein